MTVGEILVKVLPANRTTEAGTRISLVSFEKSEIVRLVPSATGDVRRIALVTVPSPSVGLNDTVTVRFGSSLSRTTICAEPSIPFVQPAVIVTVWFGS